MKKYEQIYQKYKNDIINGFLKYKQQLPSIRESCQIFQCSQTTVERAYDQLFSEGYIISQPQIGYFVTIEESKINLLKKMSQYHFHHDTIQYDYDLRSQTLFYNSKEMSLWKKYLRDVLNHHYDLTFYGDSQGEIQLREALCLYAYKMRGVLSHPQQMLITSNFQSSLFVFMSLVPRNTRIAMEYQENSQAQRVFESYGFQIVYIKSNDEGIDLNDLQQKSIDMLYINSSCQGLRKKTMSHDLRTSLIQYTANKHITIIEDDYNGELNYFSARQHVLQSMTACDNVIYCGSFSRLVLPSLRISYMVLNRHYYNLYKQLKEQYGPSASKLEQLAFSKYISDGHLSRHVKKIKKEYQKKNIMMLSCLKKHIKYPYYLNEAYLCYHIQLKKIDEQKLMTLCKTNHIAIAPIKKHELTISFASLNDDQIEPVIIKIKQLIELCH